MAIPVGALIGAGSSILGGLMGSKSSKGLAAALREATQFQRQVYETGRQDLTPFRTLPTTSAQQLGQQYGADTSIARLARLAGEQSPEFQQLQQDFLEQANREAAVRGQFFSPRAVQEIQSRGLQRLATDEASKMFDRNLALAQMGQQAAAFGGQLGQGAASGISALAGQTPVNTAWQSAALGAGGALQQGLANQRFQNLFSQYLGSRGGGLGSYNPYNITPRLTGIPQINAGGYNG